MIGANTAAERRKQFEEAKPGAAKTEGPRVGATATPNIGVVDQPTPPAEAKNILAAQGITDQNVYGEEGDPSKKPSADDKGYARQGGTSNTPSVPGAPIQAASNEAPSAKAEPAIDPFSLEASDKNNVGQQAEGKDRTTK